MQGRRLTGLMAAALLAAVSSPGVAGGAVELLRAPSAPRPSRASGYRMGRRFKGEVAKGGNPAGTKLAHQAMRGTLTINRIR